MSESNPQLTIYVPAVDEDDASNGLRGLTRLLVQVGAPNCGGGLGGEDGYGTRWESETFLMHPYCWCERETCPWCVGCDCPEDASGYTVDGKPATFEEFAAAYDPIPMIGVGEGSPIHDAQWAKANRRRARWHNPTCDFCLTGGVAATKGGGPGKRAPNFWHKPSDLKVRWYKYLGRGMEIENPNAAAWGEVLRDCIQSVTGRN